MTIPPPPAWRPQDSVAVEYDHRVSPAPARAGNAESPSATADPLESQPDETGPQGGPWAPRTQLVASIIAGTLLLVGVGLRTGLGLEWASVFAWASLAIGMVYGLRAAAEALGAGAIDIDVLMVVGAGLAAYVGHPSEGALLLFLFTLSGSLEDLAMERTRREIEALHKLMPTSARVWEPDPRFPQAGQWVERKPEELTPGQRIKVRPGELIPVDAQMVAGSIDGGGSATRSSVDQSTLTGESLPRAVEPGAALYAGTINLDNPIEAVVTRPALESSLHKVLRLVTEARKQREPIQRLIDRLSQPYALGIMIVSATVLLVWWLGFGVPPASASITAITFLIVMSPCALIIATPTATLTTIARGARAGVLFKGGQAIDRLSQIGAVCFDKTGTLTVGRASLNRIDTVGWSDERKLLSVAAGLETDSTHPIARAVHDAARAAGVSPAAVTDTRHAPGQGITGLCCGEPVAIGLYAYVEDHIPVCLRAQTRELLAKAQAVGQMAAVIAAAGAQGAAAVFVISDPIRPGAAGLVRRLGELGVSPLRMLTGDNSATARAIAESLGLDDWDAELLPEDKVRIVREMREERKAPAWRPPPLASPALPGRSLRRARLLRGVAFIGDGVNDAPALAAADVAIGIGSIGSDAALESSDIVLLNDDLEAIPWALNLARRARSILRFNIAAALAVIIIMGVATLIGSRVGWDIPMSLGVVAHEGGTLLVALNSLRLLWSPGVGM